MAPTGVSSITVSASGGGGGNGDGLDDPGGHGGVAGTVTAQIPVQPGQALNLYVGGRGGDAVSGSFSQTLGAPGNAAGGIAPGGTGGSQNSAPYINGSGTGGGGGAATEIADTSGNPLLVAAGGGGGGGGFGDDNGVLFGGDGGYGGNPAGSGSDGVASDGYRGTVTGTYGYGGAGGANAAPVGGNGTDAVSDPLALNQYNAGGGGGGGGYNGQGGGGGGGALQDSGGGGGQSWTEAGATNTSYGQASASINGQITLSWQQPFDLYVADYGYNAISIFGPASQGRPYVNQISGTSTQLSNPEGVAVDPTGRLYVANASSNSITEYAPGANGNIAPVATIFGPETQLSDPRFIALDSSGMLYVVDAASNSITEYAPGANGDATPAATIAGSGTQISNPIGIIVDPNGQIYVSNAGTNSITRYPARASGNVIPNFVIQGDQTDLDGPKGLAFNNAGALMVANDVGGITYYSTGWQGNRPPGEVLSGPLTGLANSEQVLLDPSDNSLVVDSLTQGTITTYPANAGGNIAPTATIQVGDGSQPTQLALNPLEP